jgi:glycosyltransferase involved in cell wall biosynthesis
VRGLLGALDDPVTVLANRLLPPAYTSRDVLTLPYRPGDSNLTRLLAVGRGMSRLEELPPDIDLVHYPLTVPVPRTRLPRVVTLHDLQHHELPEYFSRAERVYRRLAYDRAARVADVVVTPTAHARDMLAERLGVDPARVVVAPHGVDHERFHPGASSDVPMQLPERFLYYPANLWPHKNHARLLEGLARAEDREIGLVLTGNPYGRMDDLRAGASRLGVIDRITHLGFVDHGLVPALMRRARAMVFPSLFEGFGQPPLEAMACGCAVAAPVDGALGEVCAGAVLELDPRDPDSIAAAIDRLASDDALVADLRARGPERAREFTWARSAELHHAAYRRALGESA